MPYDICHLLYLILQMLYVVPTAFQNSRDYLAVVFCGGVTILRALLSLFPINGVKLNRTELGLCD
jgi:hypothetical protein